MMKNIQLILNQPDTYCRGGVVVELERSTRMREIGVQYPDRDRPKSLKQNAIAPLSKARDRQ